MKVTGRSREMIRLLWRTDVHCRDHTPSSRKDDWVETVARKLTEVGELAAKYDVDAVIDGGDLFDDKLPVRTSHRLVSRVARIHRAYPCPTYVNVGNHDLRLSRLDNLPENPLETLYSTGVVHRLYDEHEAVFEKEGMKVRVVGVPYHGPRYDLGRFQQIERKDEDWLVCAAHVLASPQGGEMFKNEDILKYDELADLNPGVDVWCFLPGTKVLDWNGRQFPIEEVRGSLALMGRHGEPVVTEEVHPVRQVNEEIVKLDVEGVPGVLMPGVTGEHPFWVARDLKCHLPSRRTRRCHPDKTRNSYPCSVCIKAPSVQAGWLQASEIQEGDYVAVPVPSPRPVVGVSNPQRARLLGLYLAEGHIILNRAKKPVAGVAWSFHEEETELADLVTNTVASQFGLETKSHPTTGACTQVCAYGSDIAEWFQEQGGRYSHSKSFSSSVWSWSAADKMELLLGWLLGDGHARDPEKPGRIRTEVMAGTASPQLASQMYLLALSLGLRPSYSVRPSKDGVEINGRVCGVREFHVISFYGDDGERLARLMGVDFRPRTKTKVAGFFHDGMYFARVRSVSREHYRGPVYNMRTSNEEYVAGMLVTHNCFGHWHKNQGITEVKGGKWVVNVGSLTRGSLTEDNTKREPGVVVMGFWPSAKQMPPSLEFVKITIRPAEEVFDMEKRAREEARALTVDAFVESVKSELQASSDKPFGEIVEAMELPAEVKERALEYIDAADKG